MLDTLIAAQKNGQQIDDEGIREEVDTFIFEVYYNKYLQYINIKYKLTNFFK